MKSPAEQVTNWTTANLKALVARSLASASVLFFTLLVPDVLCGYCGPQRHVGRN
jgi:hypothetical protein